ncbi:MULTISPECIES: DUF63 family protein [Haloarcula]|uniref:DUF63 family protein n=1 Tax=Haloarcula pellucida TaxID=1427151 RepID=A0A830GLI3_9EURY|nr:MULTISPECIES: DUF63 family protein [Halomicroarcula]MBX0348475.1 DUF63 family protein [Halomicroarcula pellucida]MDS0278299.1 DUF63 family protein [Halomicroarcula sp. S1AR25-4]GGN93201.1 hypothetical protein GCM10009030_18320 [Halomicroarcula pellucida]
MVLPTGFGLPPVPYLAALAGGTLVVSALLVALDPPIDQRIVVALAPWMAIGGTLHALGQPPIEVYDPVLRPLFGTPSVYFTTYVTLGTVWVLLSLFGVRRGHDETVSRNLGLTGTGILTVLLVLAAITALRSELLALVWPTVAVVGAVVLSAITLLLVALWRTPIIVRTRYAAPVVVFAHAFDGVSTAIGTDVIGVGERSPVPRAIMDFAGTLPTAPLIGEGWLFALVKLVVAVAVVVLMHQYLEDEPAEGSLLLAFIAAVGLGPATNNVVLFLFTPV